MLALLVAPLIKLLIIVLICSAIFLFLVRYTKVEKINKDGIVVKYPLVDVFFLLLVVPFLLSVAFSILSGLIPPLLAVIAVVTIYLLSMRNSLRRAGATKRQITIVMGGFIVSIVIGALLLSIFIPFLAPIICSDTSLYWLEHAFMSDCLSLELKKRFQGYQ